MKKWICGILLVGIMNSQVLADFEEIPEEEGDGIYIETTASVGVPNLNARAAMLYDVTYDRILFEKNAKQRRANASTTKMITALVAVEQGNLEQIIEVSKKAAGTGGSSIGLKTGDKITLDDLIKGLLIHSGNDAAVAIAETIAGSVEEFTVFMNEKIEEIGAVDTHFVTPHGLDEENHYSTAFDLCLIAKEVLQNEYLAEIIAQKSLEITVNGQKRTLNTTNEMLSYYEGANGVKTGYTGEAGRCLVTAAKRDDRQLISVVLGCDSKKNRTVDSIRLLNYGFQEYEVTDLSCYLQKPLYIAVEKSKVIHYQLTQQEILRYPLKESEKDKITVEYDMKSHLMAPLYRGANIGTLRIKLDNITIKQVEYILPQDILRKSWQDYLKQIFLYSLENYENMVEKILKI